LTIIIFFHNSINYYMIHESIIEAFTWMSRNLPEGGLFSKEYYYFLGFLESRKKEDRSFFFRFEDNIPKFIAVNNLFLSMEEEMKKQTEFLVNITKERVAKGELKITDLAFEYVFNIFSRKKFIENDWFSDQPIYTFSKRKLLYIFDPHISSFLEGFLEHSFEENDDFLKNDKYIKDIKLCSTFQYVIDESYLSCKDIIDIEDVTIELKMEYCYDSFSK